MNNNRDNQQTPLGKLTRLCLAEFIGTFVLVFAGCGAIVMNRLEQGMVGHVGISVSFGLAIGGTVCLAALFGGPITGASMNPARSLGPALVSGQWQYFYIYVIAPVLGAIAGGCVYGALCPDCEQCRKKLKF